MRYGKQDAFKKKDQTEDPEPSFPDIAAVADMGAQPDQNRIYCHDFAKLEESLPCILCNDEAFREPSGEGAEKIGSLQNEECQIKDGEQHDHQLPENGRDLADPRKNCRYMLLSAFQTAAVCTMCTGNQAEQPAPDRDAEQELEEELNELISVFEAEQLQKRGELVFKQGVGPAQEPDRRIKQNNAEKRCRDQPPVYPAFSAFLPELPCTSGECSETEDEIAERQDGKTSKHIAREIIKAAALDKHAASRQDPPDCKQVDEKNSLILFPDMSCVKNHTYDG